MEELRDPKTLNKKEYVKNKNIIFNIQLKTKNNLLTNLLISSFQRNYKKKFIIKNKILYFIILFSFLVLSKEENFSQITISISGGGRQKILSDSTGCLGLPSNFISLPDIIIVNGENQTKVEKYVYNLSNGINNITMIWNYQVTNCSNMFADLTNIINVDLSKFDSSGVTDMKCMFFKCSSLTSINLINFNTSLVKSMKGMFQDCYKLKSLNLYNFDTSLVTDMHHLFYECNNLTSLNLESFTTSNVTNMTGMFEACYDLKTLNLSNFDTSSVVDMYAMFHLCQSLISLDLSNFDTSKVTRIGIMFSECKSLKILNLKNFDTSQISECYNCKNMLDKDNISFFCINETKTSNIMSQYSSYHNNCSCFLNVVV